jgi:formate C-acetyltransferase
MDRGEMVGIPTGDVTKMETFEEFFAAYEKQMRYCIGLLVNSDNAIDQAHAERVPLPWLSCMVDDCLEVGKSVQEGGCHYNFTGPQGFGVANIADGMYAIRKLVYEDKTITMAELKEALDNNFGEGMDENTVEQAVKAVVEKLVAAGRTVDEAEIAKIAALVTANGLPESKKARYRQIHELIDACPKFGNDIEDIDALARRVAYVYTRPLETFSNPRGGKYQAGMYPVSANVPLGRQTGATPDGRYAKMPIADGVSPAQGRDANGPTAAANSVAKLDHTIASNGTLYNMKFHPSALSGREGLEKFAAMIRGYFDQKGMHVQFNVVDRKTLLDAQEHPEKYKHLVVRVAGYSALFTTLSRSLQDDIINRTEQGL